jgi:hypothetical protein
MSGSDAGDSLFRTSVRSLEVSITRERYRNEKRNLSHLDFLEVSTLLLTSSTTAYPLPFSHRNVDAHETNLLHFQLSFSLFSSSASTPQRRLHPLDEVLKPVFKQDVLEERV